MTEFCIKVADVVINIQTKYPYSLKMCTPFLSKNSPVSHISITQADLEHEKKLLSTTDGTCFLQDDKIEFFSLLRKTAECLIEYNTILAHGVAIAIDGVSYIFAGKSGTGKTTHMCNWMRYRPDLKVVNGDKPFIRVDGMPLVCASPWTGKECLYTNIMVPLKAVAFLKRNETNFIRPLSFSEALPNLLESFYLPDDNEKKLKTLQLLKELFRKVSFYDFQVNNMKDDCFQVAYSALHG